MGLFGYFYQDHFVNRRMSLCFPFNFTPWAVIPGSMSYSSIRNLCCDQSHGPCLHDLHLLSLRQERARCMQMNRRPIQRRRMLIPAHGRVKGRKAPIVVGSWCLVAGLGVLTRRRCPCPGRSHVELSGTDHRQSRQKGCLRRKTYFPVLSLRRCLWKPRLQPNHPM